MPGGRVVMASQGRRGMNSANRSTVPRYSVPFGVIFVSLWLLASAWPRPGLVVLGIALAGAVGWFFRRELPAPEGQVRTVRRSRWLWRFIWVLVFLPRFGWTVFRSGLHIARLALRPSLDFWPGILRIKGDLPDRRAITLFAHLITLTPGTVAVDYDEEHDDLYVHWIDVAEEEGDDLDRQASGGMRPWVRRIVQ